MRLRHEILGSNRLLMLFVVLVCTFQVTPLLFATTTTLQKVVMWVPVILFCLFKYWIFNNVYVNRMLLYGLLYALICFVYALVGVSSGGIAENMACVMYVFPVFCLMILDARCTEEQLGFVFHVLALMIVFNIVDGIRYSELYHSSSYQMLALRFRRNGMMNVNVGGATFVNTCFFFLMVCMFAFRHSQRKVERFVFTVYFCVTFCFLVFYSYKASVIVFTLMAVILMIVAALSRRKSRSVFITLFVFIVLFMLRDPIIHFVVDVLQSQKVAARLLIFATTDNEMAQVSTLTGRSNLWMVSVRSWLSSPVSFLFGTGNHLRTVGESAAVTGIGNHSEVFDVLAKYGVVGGFVFFMILRCLYLYLMSFVQERFRYEVRLFFLMVFVFALTKRIESANVAIVLFVLLPLCVRYCSFLDKKDYMSR